MVQRDAKNESQMTKEETAFVVLRGIKSRSVVSIGKATCTAYGVHGMLE